jgi:exopolysaccharide biosynthesis polyprenyl glycosylphosphotransferase
MSITLSMKRSEIIFGILRLVSDYLATFGAIMLAYFLRPITDLIPGVQYTFFPEQLPLLQDYVWFALWAALFLVILFAFNGLYNFKLRLGFGKQAMRVSFLISAWLMFIIAYYFLVVHQLFFSRIALAHIWVFTVFFVVLGRWFLLWLQRLLRRAGIGRRRVLFIGAGELARRMYHAFIRSGEYTIVGALATHRRSTLKGELTIIGRFESLIALVKRHQVEEIIHADPELSGQESAELLSFCRSHHLKYHFIPDLVRLQRSNVDIEVFDDIPLISLKQTPLEGWGRVFKHLFDVMLSVIFIVLLLPVWILIPLLIKFDSKGPVFYKSKRKFRHKIFNAYKFRSMAMGADKKKAGLLKKNERSGPLFKIKNDPRITRIGGFLRKTSIDELPQLFNVLMGNMSLVGPRPHMPEEVDQYKAHHFEVFALKPGITGLAQVSGRSNLDFEEEVKLDIFYIENWSPWLDIKIILKSIGVVFKADGH